MRAISFLIGLLLGLVIRLSSAQYDFLPTNDLYDVPNPFKTNDASANVGQYYAIKATQTVFSRHKTRKQFDIEEYFSLSRGVSFSVHQERDLKYNKANSWVIITDSLKGQSYLVRNIKDDLDGDKLECELDHIHGHKHVFPWMYEYKLDSYNSSASVTRNKNDQQEASVQVKRGRSKRYKKKKRRREFSAAIYGIAGVWLNAIGQKVKSQQVGNYSPYQLVNSWSFQDAADAAKTHLKVKLLFEKLSDQDSASESLSHDQVQAKLDKTKLDSVRIDRSNFIDNDPNQSGDLASLDFESENFIISSFSQVSIKQDEQLTKLNKILYQCRLSTRQHRLFPNLMHDLTRSAQRFYAISYIAHIYPLMRIVNSSPHHALGPIVFARELFSLSREAEVRSYQQLNLTQPLEKRRDSYLKIFTQGSNSTRSSRHSTVHYHLIDGPNLGQICLIGDPEPAPENHLFIRPVHFYRPNGARFSGHLTGLGALLMNAADMHYKSFNLNQRRLRIAVNPNDSSSVSAGGGYRTLWADEWQLFDKKTAWMFYFYFDSSNNWGDLDAITPGQQQMSFLKQSRGDISRLVRVDIRKPTVVDSEDGVIQDANEEERDEYDLLARYDIVEFSFEEPYASTLERIFTPPTNCVESQNQVNNHSSDSSDDEDDGEKFNYDQLADISDSEDADGSGDDDDDDDADDDDSVHEQSYDRVNQDEADQIESGQLDEDYPMADFFDSIDSQPAYEIWSRVELNHNDDDNDDGTKNTSFIYLHELVDLEQEVAFFRIYTTEEAYKNLAPQESYYIDYSLELIFELTPNNCRFVDDITKSANWLRLFSRRYDYYVVPNTSERDYQPKAHISDNSALIDSNRIPLLGVGALWQHADDSPDTEFIGKRRRRNNSGAESQILIWSDDSYGMRIFFNFLLFNKNNRRNITTDNDDDADDHHYDQRLYLDTIEVENVYESDFMTSFEPIRVKVLSIKGQSSRKRFVPEQCSDQHDIAMRLKSKIVIDVKMPDFFNFISETGAYYARYRVTHSHIDLPEYREQSKLITEQFDRRNGRGRFHVEFNDFSMDCYVEIDGRKMFAHSAQLGKCKEIGHLKTLADLGPGLDSDNVDFDLDKMYGLANLWIRLSKEPATLRIVHKLNKQGQREELYIYQYYLDATSGGDNNEQHLKQDVQLVFKQWHDQKQKSPMSLADANGDNSLPDWYTGKIKTRQDARMTLSSVNLRPFSHFGMPSSQLVGNDTNQSELFLETNIEVLKFMPIDMNEETIWRLPQVCQALSKSSDGSAAAALNDDSSSSSSSFPRLSSLMANLKYFHLKSEIVVKRSDNSGPSRYSVVDEWLHDSMVRMRSRGVGKGSELDLDFILYTRSREVFDLSQPFNCRTEFPNRGQVPLMDSNTIDFWTDNSTLVNHPSQLYYGALALWLLAEKSAANSGAKLISKVDLAPPPTAKFDFEQFELDLMTEVWHIESDSGGGKWKWDFDIKFSEHSKELPNGQLFKWHSLTSIEIKNSQEIFGHSDILIEVINYKYHTEPGPVPPVFMLPIGWGCLRSHSDDQFRWDDFVAPILLNESMSVIYEAHLELINSLEDIDFEQDDISRIGGGATATVSKSGSTGDEANNKLLNMNATTSAHLTGAIWSIRDDRDKLHQDSVLNLTAHSARVHYSNGTMQAKRTIYDLNNNIVYEIDEKTGSCQVESQQQASIRCLNMEFPIGQTLDNWRQETICLDEQLMNLLFFQTRANGFKVLQKFTTLDGIQSTRYERQYSNLTLTKNLIGPVSVVRQFADSGSRLHRSIEVKVFLFNEKRDQLRAIFRFQLHQFGVSGLTDLIGSMNVFQCFNTGALLADKQMASYVIEYQIDSSDGGESLAQFETRSIRSQFYKLLIANVGLMPLQLDGRARVQFDHTNGGGGGGVMQIHFNVLDAPPVHLYYGHEANCSMSKDIESVAELKLATNLNECSNWCAQTNCVAMSYCKDLKCLVVNKRTIERNLGEKLASSDGLRSFIAEGKQLASNCDYYHRVQDKMAMSLEKFALYLERKVNAFNVNKRPNSLAIQIGDSSNELMNPSAFHETKGKFYWELDDHDKTTPTTTAIGSADHSADDNFVFATIKIDHSIDLTSLALLNAQLGTQFEPVLVEAETMTQCFKACESQHCLLLSFCAQRAGTCTMLKGNKVAQSLGENTLHNESDIKSLINLVKQDNNCRVMMRDFRTEYDRIEGVNEPQAFLAKLNGYSGMECALACQIEGDKCLSFDYCGSKKSNSLDYRGDDNADDEQQVQVCFLQKHHLALDTIATDQIDVSSWGLPGGKLQVEILGKVVECDHYSKSVLKSYKQIPNRRLSGRLDTIVRGLNPEKCAIECQQDDACEAFEYCYRETRQPTQSCQFVRRGGDIQLDGALDKVNSDEQISEKQFGGDQLRLSRACSLYVAKMSSREAKLGQSCQSDGLMDSWTESAKGLLLTKSTGFWRAVPAVICYLVAAAIVGTLLQLAYTKFAGQPIELARGYRAFS